MAAEKVDKPKSREIIPGPGFRIRSSFDRLDATLVRQFADFDAADVSDQLNRLSAVSPAIRYLAGRDDRVVGPACTVKVHPADNLMVHAALDVAQPGDVVVVDAGGTSENATLGNLVCAKARHLGLAGYVIDGLVRDLPKIEVLAFPVWARGGATTGPWHNGPGEINYPVSCGGVVVNPGDIVVADPAGVVIVPRDDAEELLARLRTFEGKNERYFAAIQHGDFSNEWVRRALAERECRMIP